MINSLTAYHDERVNNSGSSFLIFFKNSKAELVREVSLTQLAGKVTALKHGLL